MGKTFNMVGGGTNVIANPAMTGTEIDLQGLEVSGTKYKVPLIRPNLLDNWYFVGGGSQQGGGQFPVNQKGQTSYTNEGYGIDRWRTNCSVTLGQTGIVIAYSSSSGGHIHQIIPILQKGTYRASIFAFGTGDLQLSMRTSDWSILQTITITNPSGLYELPVTVSTDLTNAKFYIGPRTTNAQFRIETVKLELGDTQTLAHNEGTEATPVWVLNEIPNYTEELWKCQRYFQLFASSSYRPTYGEDYRPPMRLHSPRKGTITIGGTTYYYADANL